MDQLPQDVIIKAQRSRPIKLIRTLPTYPTNKFILRIIIRNIRRNSTNKAYRGMDKSNIIKAGTTKIFVSPLACLRCKICSSGEKADLKQLEAIWIQFGKFSQGHPENIRNHNKGILLFLFHKYNSIKGFYIFR